LRDAARYSPVVAFLRAGDMSNCLLLKSAGFKPSPNTTDARHLDVIGPVHLDIHVDDLTAALAKALEAGATQEHVSHDAQHGSVAFRSDHLAELLPHRTEADSTKLGLSADNCRLAAAARA